MCLLGSTEVAGRCRAEQFWAWPLLCQRDVKEIPYPRAAWLEATPSPHLTAPRCRVWTWDVSGSHAFLHAGISAVWCWYQAGVSQWQPPQQGTTSPCPKTSLWCHQVGQHSWWRHIYGYICLRDIYWRWVLTQLICEWNLVIWAYLQLCPRNGWHIYWAFFLPPLPNHMPQLSWNGVFSSFGEEGWKDEWTVTHIWVTPVKVTFDYFPEQKKHCIFGAPKQGHFQQSQQVPFMPWMPFFCWENSKFHL